MFKKMFLLFVLIGLLLSACTPAVQGFVDLPDKTEAGITAVVVWLVSWLFVQLITLLPFLKFLEDFKTPLSMALAGQLISLIENAVPDAFGGVAIAGITFILTILALFGVGEVFKARGYRGFR